MMADALRSSFDPPLVSFAQAFYLVGSGLVTVGLSETNALGGARWIVLASGFCGLAVMTMAVTYLLVVQSSLAGRDTGILKLMTAAGDPPSAIVLLERYAQLDFQAGIADVLEHGRDWSASVAQSHSAHPSLIYFRSAGTGAGWPAALGALVDLSLVVEHLLVMPDARGRASLMRDEACGLAQELSALLALPNVKAGHLTVEDVTDVCERLEHAGYSVKLVPEIDIFITQRSRYDALVRSLADHLGQPAARFP